MAAASRPRNVHFSLSQFFGLAKGLDLTPEEAKAMAYDMTGRDSLKKLTQQELDGLCWELIIRKDKKAVRPGRASNQQLYKMEELEKQLGWADSPARLAAFLTKYYHVASPQWLTATQASKAIESLKKLVQHQREEQTV